MKTNRRLILLKLLSILCYAVLLPALCVPAFASGTEESAADVILSDDASDFVLLSDAVPDAILEIRYYSTYNFVGDLIDGYEYPHLHEKRLDDHLRRRRRSSGDRSGSGSVIAAALSTDRVPCDVFLPISPGNMV